MISDLNVTESAVRDILAIRWQRATDANDGEQACISVLDGLLRVLADVTHLAGLLSGLMGDYALAAACPRRIAESSVLSVVDWFGRA